MPQNKYKKWNDLSMVEKLPYLQTALSSGVYSPVIIGERYDNYMKRLEEQGYNDYLGRLAESRSSMWGISPTEALQEIQSDNTYDYRSMYFDNPVKAESYINTNHFPDTYKYPNHPTFSDESIYSNNNVVQPPYLTNPVPNAGNWYNNMVTGEEYFVRSPNQEATPQETQKYLARTPEDKVANEIYTTALSAGFTREQALALLGNAYVETGLRGGRQVGGPATGYYQFEPTTRKKYDKWYAKNPKSGKRGSAKSETLFIVDLFKNRDSELNTPWSRASNPSDITKYRLANMDFYKGYTTDAAFNDWESGDIGKATLAFTRLFERPKYHKSSKRVAAAKKYANKYPDVKPKETKLPLVNFDDLQFKPNVESNKFRLGGLLSEEEDIPYKRDAKGNIVVNKYTNSPIRDYTRASWYEPWMEKKGAAYYYYHPESISEDRERFRKADINRDNQIKTSKVKQSIRNKRIESELESFNRAISNISDTQKSTIGGLQKNYAEAVKTQEEERKDALYPYKLMGNSLVTAAELASSAYMIGKGLKALNWLPNTRIINGIYQSDNAQVLASTLGTAADAYQLMTAANQKDKIENSLELPADVSGIIGGTNWFRRAPLFTRYGAKIDNTLDFLGYTAAGYDAIFKPINWIWDNIGEPANNSNF